MSDPQRVLLLIVGSLLLSLGCWGNDLGLAPQAPSPTYAFDLANTEVCDGVDNDNDGSIDEEQTGYTDFCDPSALVTPEGYPFVYPLEYWTSAFDALRYDTPNARDSYSKTLERAAAADPCTGYQSLGYTHEPAI